MNGIIKKYITKEYLSKIFMVFIIIQPVIDIYILFKQSVTDFFGFSPATIIRIIFMGILLLLTIFSIKIKKVHIWFIIYGLLVLTYTVFHHINAAHLISVVPGNFYYSLTSEIFYIIRMLIPLAVIVISYYINFDDIKLNNIFKWLIGLISGSIVITNLLCISLGSYSKVKIKGNILSWFIDNYKHYNYQDLASKGFFNDPNRIAALLVLITPILLYLFITKPNRSNKILVFIQLFAMYMLGTKVSSYGFTLLIFITIIIYLYFCFIKKELKFLWNINNTLIACLLICLILTPHSPVVNRTKVDNNIYKNYINNKNNRLAEEKNRLAEIDKALVKSPPVTGGNVFEKLIIDNGLNLGKVILVNNQFILIDKTNNYTILNNFIETNYQFFSINPSFIEFSYPHQYDPLFWYEIMKHPLDYRVDFRNVETAMLKRVKTINNNQMDNWYGITFTRMQHIFDLERDFISHYYTLGIIGLILILMPYVFLFLVCGLKMLSEYKNKFNFKNTMFILGISITLFAAFYSGNVMDGLIVTIILGFILGQLVRNIFYREKI